MPEYVPPRNDNTRLGFLKRAVHTAKQDHMLGNQYLSDMLVHAIEEFIPQFEKRLQSINSYLSRRSVEIMESRETFRTLMIYVRDMWNVLKRRVKRLNQPASVLNFYGLPQNGHAPNPTSKDMWFVLADKLIKGDELAVKAGYPAMSNPSAEELKEILEQALSEMRDVSSADREYDNVQAELEELRRRADELVKEVMAELRFHLRHFDRPSQRRIMRSYGVVFRYRQGEAGEEETEEDPGPTKDE
jgi:hypothetical protein